MDNLTPLHSRFICTDADTGPVCGLHGARPRVTILDERAQELVHHVGMGPTVPATLDKGEVVGVLNAPCKLLDLLWKQVCKVGQRGGVLGRLE